MTLDELGGSALYLLSDLSTGVTGEIHFVDSGYNIISMPRRKISSRNRRGIAPQVYPAAIFSARWNAGRAMHRAI